MMANPWMKCKCGKIHISTFVGIHTKCKCGLELRPQIVIHSINQRGK